SCVAPVHLEGFGSLDGIAAAKAEIYTGLPQNGIAVLNLDDEYSDYWQKAINPRRTICFAVHHDADVRAQDIQLDRDARPKFRLSIAKEEAWVQLQLIGEHNVTNALAAAALATACQIPFSIIVQGLEQAQAEKMRLQAKPGWNST